MPEKPLVSSPPEADGSPLPRSWPLALFPAAKLLLHLATIRGYGIFRDELYYLACADRLAFGYVDHPPLSILLLWAWRLLFGDSLVAIRLLPALAGAATVLVVGLIARGLVGGRFAQSAAMIAAGLAPVWLSFHHFVSMNAFDILVWALAALAVVRYEQWGARKFWPVLGLILGLGLENKISVLWLGLGLAAGFLLTPRRRDFLTPWPWVGGALALALFLPHLLWQVAEGWPTLEFIRNATQEKMAAVAPWAFIRSQIEMMNPFAAPLWILGLGWLLLAPRAKAYRSLGWAYLVVLLVLIANGSSRSGYLAAVYGWLLPAGAVALEGWTARPGRRWLRGVAVAVLVATGALLAPFGLPVLPVERYVAYARALGVGPSTEERKELAELPQFYADMHGWEAIVDAVAGILRRLPPGDRAKAAVFAPDYGVAGALEHLGRGRVPRVLSGHNNYWLWGPGDATGEVVLVIGGEPEELARIFERVEQAATIECGRCMPYENHRPIYLCRGARMPLVELWPEVKHFD